LQFLFNLNLKQKKTLDGKSNSLFEVTKEERNNLAKILVTFWLHKLGTPVFGSSWTRLGH